MLFASSVKKDGGSFMAKRMLFCVLVIIFIGIPGIYDSARLMAEAGSNDRQPFTIIVLPDTQLYSCSFPENFYKQTRWIKENVRKENIVFVTHVGDIVQSGGGGTNPVEWERTNKAMSALDGIVPWAVAPGNHDYDQVGGAEGKAEVFLKYYGPDRFKGYPWFGGNSPDGLNTYQFFSGGGLKFIIFHLECDVPDDAIAWAESILKKYPDLPAIVTLHVYVWNDGEGQRKLNRPWLRKDEGNPGEKIWSTFLSKNPRIFMVLCGHAPGEWHQFSTNDAGDTVFELLTDYQHLEGGGNGWLRILKFVPAQSEIQVKTYSPVLDEYKTDDMTEFSVPFDFATGKIIGDGVAIEIEAAK